MSENAMWTVIVLSFSAAILGSVYLIHRSQAAFYQSPAGQEYYKCRIVLKAAGYGGNE